MTDTADDFIAELGRTVKLVVAREVGPLRELLAAVGAVNVDLGHRLEEAEAALAAIQGRERLHEDAAREIVSAAADDLRAEWAARDAELTEDGEEPDWRGMVASAVQEAFAPAVALLEALPPPPDVSGFATIVEVGAIRDEVRGMVEAIPGPRDWGPEIEAVRAAIPQSPDLSGFAITEEVNCSFEKVSKAFDGVAKLFEELPEPRDWNPEIDAVRQAIPPSQDVSGFVNRSEVEEIRGLMVRQTAEIRAEFHEAIRGIELKEGPPGPVGRMSIARAWADDGVTYAGEVRTHAGATWQAARDTGKAPGGDDWICLAGRGEDGKAAPRFRICGTFGEGPYTELDIVALNGASFVALRDDPGPCPGDGWQLWARQGKPGEKLKGDKGDKGDRAPRPVGFKVDPEAVALTLALEDGTELTADLYPLLEQVAK